MSRFQAKAAPVELKISPSPQAQGACVRNLLVGLVSYRWWQHPYNDDKSVRPTVEILIMHTVGMHKLTYMYCIRSSCSLTQLLICFRILIMLKKDLFPTLCIMRVSHVLDGVKIAPNSVFAPRQ